MANQDYISTLTIASLFDKTQYVIPIYQRNYAWVEAQIVQLIQDIYDAETENYYLGSLVVFKREKESRVSFETIDGQQRLTTLNILMSVLRHKHPEIANFKNTKHNLSFDSREISSKTIEHLSLYGYTQTTIKQNTQMTQAFDIIDRKLHELFSSANAQGSNSLQDFVDYLANNVKILRIEVPTETDLNHYFEVMNNRGEQLEKHEILKAQFLNVLSKSDDADIDRKTFGLLWEACSQMNRYVQYAYPIDIRRHVFGASWVELPNDFESLKARTEKGKYESQETASKKLHALLEQNGEPIQKGDDPTDHPQTPFTPVVSFPNFLLHVLRVSLKENVQLDDKKLLQEFDKYIFDTDDENQKIENVRKFGYALLKSKFLFDQHIVKRAYRNGTDDWHLLKLKKRKNEDQGYYLDTFSKGDDDDENQENKTLVMLLSMFHVSFPQTMYKHWLTGAMYYLYNQEAAIVAKEYLRYLEKMSDAFFFDRFTRTELDYFDIIFNHECNLQNEELTAVDISENLHLGTHVQNFIFNRLDYLLRKDFDKYKKQVTNFDYEYGSIDLKKFEFGFRSSVEHFSPQHPKSNLKAIKNIDDFGNLCLISRSKNSELSNYSPQAKKEHYLQSKTIESLKQRLMMCYKEWNEETVEEHQALMIQVLKEKTV